MTMLIKSMYVTLMVLGIFLNQYVIYCHFHRIHHAVNDARDLTDSIRHIFGFWKRNPKPKWYPEHHRPESAPKPFENPSVWSDSLPEIYKTFDEAIMPEEASSSTIITSPRTSTTTTTTTQPPMLMTPGRSRHGFPSFPNRDSANNVRLEDSEFADKPGYCPGKPTGSWICSSLCSLDSDCRGQRKCCPNRCGALTCVLPEKEID